MKKILLLSLLILLGLASFAQHKSDVSIFHRLLIYNDENELMLVKLKEADIWVTPGFYQDTQQFIKKGLKDIAATYGMEISAPELKGAFSVMRVTGDKQEMLLRNIYSCNYLDGEVHFPENQSFEISEIKWLPMKEALSLIPFESVRMFIEQTDTYPNVVWGGSLSGVKKGREWNYKIVEKFYPLFTP